MKIRRLAIISFWSGVIPLLLFGSIPLVLHLFPLPFGAKSLFHSAAWPWFFLSSCTPHILGPLALISGVKALRRPDQQGDRKAWFLAWIGTILGGLWTCFVVVIWLVFFLVVIVNRE